MDDPTRVQRCINLKLAGKAWVDAIWFAHANHQSALVSSHIAPVLDAAVQELINRLGGPGGVIALFERHSSRLLFVRQDKLEKRMLEDEFEDGADADLYSDTTSRVSTNRSRTSRGSGSSRSSRGSKNSRMTHRSRRRHEAKKTSLREGMCWFMPNIVCFASMSVVHTDMLLSMTMVRAITAIFALCIGCF
eukprot:m.1002011 g.1002011  ORF g.1002011 m.1002011 type:complete len:191 (+) comp24034_c0_seq5:299-871(+)